MVTLALPFMMVFVETTALNATGLGQVAQTGKIKMAIVDAKLQMLKKLKQSFCNEICNFFT
jgi:hypothetical protein